MTFNLMDFGAWQATQSVIERAQRLSELEELRIAVKVLSETVEYLQRG